MTRGRSPSRFGPATWSSIVAVALAASAALVGVFWPHVYRDEAIVRDGWFPNDLVTLLVTIPALVVARSRAAKGSRGAALVWLGTLHYLVYNGAFYVLGATLNVLFPLYVAMTVTALWSLIHLAARTPAADATGPHRGVAAWMIFMALGLGTVWIAKWAGAMLHPATPTRFDEAPEFLRLVAAMDLSFMVAFFLPGAIWLWRGRPWGHVIGVTLNVSAAIYNLVLVGGSVVQLRAGLAGAGPMIGLWAFLAAGCGASAIRLLGSTRRAPS